MAELTYRDAVAAGIAQEMERDERVVFLGEDVAAAGGVFKATVGLLDKFGPGACATARFRSRPFWRAMGAAMTASDHCRDHVLGFSGGMLGIVANEIAKMRYMTNARSRCRW